MAITKLYQIRIKINNPSCHRLGTKSYEEQIIEIPVEEKPKTFKLIDERILHRSFVRREDVGKQAVSASVYSAWGDVIITEEEDLKEAVEALKQSMQKEAQKKIKAWTEDIQLMAELLNLPVWNQEVSS